MKFYLASRYDDRRQLCEIRERLLAQGHEVTARWLNGSHELHEGVEHAEDARRFAEEDLRDIERADAVVLFNNPASLESVRGGRHIEFGYALALGKLLLIVGPRLSVFHHLEQVYQFDQWDALLECTSLFTMMSLRGAQIHLEMVTESC